MGTIGESLRGKADSSHYSKFPLFQFCFMWIKEANQCSTTAPQIFVGWKVTFLV